MAYVVVLGCVVLGLAALTGGLTSENELGRDPIRESESHLALLHRDRRALQGEIHWLNLPGNKRPFCYCGKYSWLDGFATVNTNETRKCASDLKVNWTAIKDEEMLPVIIKVGETTRCELDCVFQKLNLIDSEGNLKKPEVNVFFKDHVFLDDDLKEIGFKVVDRCLNNGTANSVILEGILSFAKNSTCGEEAMKFINCMFLEMVQDCPDALKRNDVDRCKNIYNSYEKGRRASQAIHN